MLHKKLKVDGVGAGAADGDGVGNSVNSSLSASDD